MLYRLLTGVILFLSGSVHAAAQHDPYEVLFNGISSEADNIPLPATSEELFLQPLSGEGSLFGDVSRYGLSAVRYSRRGITSRERSVSLMGADLSGSLNSGAAYGVWNALRRLPLEVWEGPGAVWYTGGSVPAGRASYGFDPAIVRDRTSAGMFVTDRKGRLGIKASTSGRLKEKWTYMAAVYRRWGRDATVKGVFTDRTAWSVALSGELTAAHRLTFISAGESGSDGLRSYLTDEVTALTGDNYYNPSWGYQDGRVRNSRVAKSFIPVTAISYRWSGGGKLDLTATLSHRGGTESTSGISWLDAATPYPDYYRYLPSYASSNMIAGVITEKWKSGDPSVTGIDWNNLYAVNSLNSATAVYTVSNRVEKVSDLQAFAAAAIRIDRATEVTISARVRSDNVRRFRRMKDLLGGIAPEDIDQYLYEDEIYGDRTLNNVREPHRKVNEGDIFGYDYHVRASKGELLLAASHTADGLTVDGSLGVGYTSFRRKGNYEKEIYPGELSYGRSERGTYETYFAEVSARYAFNPKHSITGHGHASRTPQQWATHFITPTYSNATTEDAGPVTAAGAEGGYNYRNRTLRVGASLWYSVSRGRSAVYNYWDDIASVYSAMHVKGAGEQAWGLEAAADWDLHSRWNLMAAFALGSYKYTKDPDVDIYSENTLGRYVTDAVTYLKGYHTGASPENIFTTRLSYNGRAVSAGLAVNYLGGRYIVPSPLRRMQRAYNLALSDETRGRFTDQEKLGDAFTIDATVLKSFRIKEGYLSFFLAVSNLLDNRDMVYNGYEQMRIARRGSGVNASWSLFGNKYLYAYGRTYYFSATWTF